VIWDFAGRTIPDNLLSRLSSMDNWSDFLEPYLAPREIRALELRAKKLLRDKKFPPVPRDRRAFPYPPL